MNTELVDLTGSIVPSVIDQHAENASFSWRLRNNTVRAPHYSLDELSALDDKVVGNLDGLRISGQASWEICKDALTAGCPGEYFTAAVLALESGEASRIADILEQAAGSEDGDAYQGIISALGWLAYEQAEPCIRQFLDSSLPEQKRIGIAASAIHRKAPGPSLLDGLHNEEPLLRARSLKAAGELGQADLLPFIESNLTDDNEKCRFYAAWSATLLGKDSGIPVLKLIAATWKPYREEAAKIALRKMPPTEALAWQTELAQNAETRRIAIIGAGAIGDPALIPWLIEQMHIPEHARAAGEAFTMVTGLDIAFEDLEGEWPEGFEAGPNDDPEDENVEMDGDDDLPWPDPALIRGWWENNHSRFNNGTRYLLGLPLTPENLRQILGTGRQRQRYAAAMELAILQPGQPLFNVRAPGYRQIHILKG